MGGRETRKGRRICDLRAERCSEGLDGMKRQMGTRVGGETARELRPEGRTGHRAPSTGKERRLAWLSPRARGPVGGGEVHTGPGPEHTALSGQAAAGTKGQSYSAPWDRGKDTRPQVGRPGKPLVKLTRYANRHPALFVDRSPDTCTSVVSKHAGIHLYFSATLSSFTVFCNINNTFNPVLST